MIFSSGLVHLRCVKCGHEIMHFTSSAIFYYLVLLVGGLAIIVRLYGRAFDQVPWHLVILIAIELAALIGSFLLWSTVLRLFRENQKACSKCGGQFEDLGGGFYHGIVPNLDDVGIGLLFAVTQVGIGFAILRLGTSS